MRKSSKVFGIQLFTVLVFNYILDYATRERLYCRIPTFKKKSK